MIASNTRVAIRLAKLVFWLSTSKGKQSPVELFVSE